MGNKVLVTLCEAFRDEDAIVDEWEGDYEAGMAPNGSLVISEKVPDMDPKNPSGMKDKMVALYAPNNWLKVEIV